MNILAIGAHPDDLELNCGGTLARFARRGDTVVMCNLTSGNLGSVPGLTDHLDMRAVRLEEARKAAGVIGADHRPPLTDDLVLQVTPDLVNELVALIRDVRPDLIITHSPGDYNPDHDNAFHLTFAAAVAAAVPGYQTGPNSGSGAVPRVPIYQFATMAGIGFIPEEYVDITDTYQDKIAMIKQHSSQLHYLTALHRFDPLEYIRITSEFWGLQAGARYAEAFRRYPVHGRLTTERLLP